MKVRKDAAQLPPRWQPPGFCDYDCSFAAFTPPEASGACRREQAVWCTFLKRHNNKNAKCLVPPGTRPGARTR